MVLFLQSSENVKIWAAITQLQEEMTTYGSRLTKLETEVSSIKSTVYEYSGAGIGTNTTGQTAKRGRPKKVTSADVLPSMDESQPRARARKIISCKTQSENKVLHSEKESFNMDKEKRCDLPVDGANVQQESGGKISNIFTNSCNNFEINGSNLKMLPDVKITSNFQGQVTQELPGIQIGGFSLNLTKDLKGSVNKLKDQKTEFSFQSEQVKGATNSNGSHGWASNILPVGRNLLDMRSHTLFDNSNASVIRQGGKVVPGWSFVNEGNPSEENEGMAVRSSKDEYEAEDEMEEDTTSGND